MPIGVRDGPLNALPFLASNHRIKKEHPERKPLHVHSAPCSVDVLRHRVFLVTGIVTAATIVKLWPIRISGAS